MVLLRHMLGDALRRLRLRQGRTLREVSSVARVSLGYLSEVERGQKEASSELLASICGALDVPLSSVLLEVSERVAAAENLAPETVHVPDTVPAGRAPGTVPRPRPRPQGPPAEVGRPPWGHLPRDHPRLPFPPSRPSGTAEPR